MLSEWLQLQWVVLPILAIPLAILLGMRWANGAILVTSVGALLGVAFAWYRRAINPLGYNATGITALDSALPQIGGYLLLAAWALALAHAVQSRRWVWFALLTVAVFLSSSTSILEDIALNSCGFTSPDNLDFSACQSPNHLFFLLTALGQALGPALCLLYVILAPRGHRRQRQLLEGLVVSSLRDGHDGLPADDDAISAD